MGCIPGQDPPGGSDHSHAFRVFGTRPGPAEAMTEDRLWAWDEIERGAARGALPTDPGKTGTKPSGTDETPNGNPIRLGIRGDGRPLLGRLQIDAPRGFGSSLLFSALSGESREERTRFPSCRSLGLDGSPAPFLRRHWRNRGRSSWLPGWIPKPSSPAFIPNGWRGASSPFTPPPFWKKAGTPSSS